ncbi:alpha/beta fold hydrolase [Albimonas pacifica]|uniref:Pimeloyl-ACP methyl ester carboxylesterase n=1 Tax=Albimonas pacifica TaxID=1114924 RepID=A0A1I3E4G1_9RHOB|nr:alpha/beta fold hydrolase [Albimonas pacifica]SFH93877.1 Pimeloyl-ACP methyl ester carboxylesterase [Albimonas pacifica]
MTDLKISLLGELRVERAGEAAPLPASRKARALLALLVATGRPHRRERLCELFWNLPDDPRAALRWSLSKLRPVVDAPDRPRIVADRERVRFDGEGVSVDLLEIHARLRAPDGDPPLPALEEMARRLDALPFDGLDGAGVEGFDAWLAAEREDARAARVELLRRMALHPDAAGLASEKWRRLWREADPVGVERHERATAGRAVAVAQATRAEALAAPPAAAAPMSAAAPTAAAAPGRDPAAARRAARAALAARQAADAAAAPLVATGPGRRPGARARSRALRAQRIGFCETSDRVKIAWATVGAGPPMLKAANWLNHLEYDWGSPIWGRTFAEIARLRTFIRYDERGCGLSDWDVDDLSFEAFVTDLEAVADHLGLERFPLLGISQGAAVSIEYAVRHPERVSALVLFGSYAAGWRLDATPEEQARREAVRQLTEVGWGTDNPAYRHIFSQTFMPDATHEELAWFDEFQRLTASPCNAARFQDAFGWIDVRERLALVKAPTIVMHARDDLRIPLEMARAVARGIPGARFVPVESRNHILVDREPAWRGALETVGLFLAEHGV